MDDKLRLKQALAALLSSLPKSLEGRIAPAWKDAAQEPDFIDKPEKGIRHHRIRLLPTAPRQPKGFWSKSWCFYEMNVGTYDRTADRCEVQFFMAGNQKVCGNGAYNQMVDKILAMTARKRPDAEHISILGNSYAHLRIRHRIPEPRRMAEDMLWIVTNTLDQLESIPYAQP